MSSIVTKEYFDWIENFTEIRKTFGNDERCLGELEISENDYNNIKNMETFFDEIEEILIKYNLEIENHGKYQTQNIKIGSSAYTFAKEFENPSRVWISKIQGNDKITKQMVKDSIDCQTILDLSKPKSLVLNKKN